MDGPPQTRHKFGVVVHHPSTFGAHEVNGSVVVERLPRRRILVAGFSNKSELGEERERPVDRGPIDRRVDGVHTARDRRRREMVAGRGKDIPDRSASGGDPVPVGAQLDLEIHADRVGTGDHLHAIANELQ